MDGISLRAEVSTRDLEHKETDFMSQNRFSQEFLSVKVLPEGACVVSSDATIAAAAAAARASAAPHPFIGAQIARKVQASRYRRIQA